MTNRLLYSMIKLWYKLQVALLLGIWVACMKTHWQSTTTYWQARYMHCSSLTTLSQLCMLLCHLFMGSCCIVVLSWAMLLQVSRKSCELAKEVEPYGRSVWMLEGTGQEHDYWLLTMMPSKTINKKWIWLWFWSSFLWFCCVVCSLYCMPACLSDTVCNTVTAPRMSNDH